MRPVQTATLLTAVLATGVSASAAVLTDPQLFTGADAIDPAGQEELNASAPGAATQASLESTPGFAAIHSYGAFSGNALTQQGQSNYIDFTSGTHPDVRITLSDNGPNDDIVNDPNGSNNTGGQAGTSLEDSNSSSIRLSGNDNNPPFTMTFDFGQYDADTGGFTQTTTGVNAVGFTISRFLSTHTITVDFKDAAGNIISTQSLTGNDTDDDYAIGENGNTNGLEALFAYADTGAGKVASFDVIRDAPTQASKANGLDDLAFTPVPEPGSLALLGLGGLALLGRRRLTASRR